MGSIAETLVIFAAFFAGFYNKNLNTIDIGLTDIFADYFAALVGSLKTGRNRARVGERPQLVCTPF